MFFGNAASANGDTGGMNRMGISADQGVPVGQWFALGHQAVGAGFGQPAQFDDVGRRQRDAVGYQAVAVTVFPATAGLWIEQITGDPGVADFTGGGMLELLQAAPAAAVAQRFPLGRAQRVQFSVFPESVHALFFLINRYQKPPEKTNRIWLMTISVFGPKLNFSND